VKQLFLMALRNLGRNKRRSLFSAAALGLGVALLLFMAAFVEGEVRGALEATVRMESGHLQIRAQSYDETKTSLAWEDLVEEPFAIAEQVAQLDPVSAATPRLYASGIILSAEDSLGVRVIGIDPASAAHDPFRQGVISGEWLTADDRQGVLIGHVLAVKRGLQVGDEIPLLINNANGEIDQQMFTIRGTYSTKTPTYDEATVFMPLLKAQAITQAGDHASTVWVLLHDPDQTEAVANALQSGRYETTTWLEMNEMIITLQSMASAMMVVFYLIVLAITATVIVNTLVMAVFERTREIGILSAIGMKDRRIMAAFFIESFLLALGGIAMGLVLGGVIVWYTSTYGVYLGNMVTDMGMQGFLLGERIYAHLKPIDAITLTVTAFVVTLVASAYPARLAARMEPVQALHGEE